jgi:large subunit ribosomal protein L33
MAKSKKKVETVFLVCDETGDYNYTIRRRTGGEKLKLSKYSPRLRRHTPHTEKKKQRLGPAARASVLIGELWSGST